MSAAPAPPSPRRSPGRIALVAALLVSLALNAVAVGAVVRVLQARDAVLGSDGPVAVLPREMRREVLAALRANRERLAPAGQRLRAAREAAVAAATADPYDAQAMDAALAEVRAAADEVLDAVLAVAGEAIDARAR